MEDRPLLFEGLGLILSQTKVKEGHDVMHDPVSETMRSGTHAMGPREVGPGEQLQVDKPDHPAALFGDERCGKVVPWGKSVCRDCNPAGLPAPSRSQYHATAWWWESGLR